MRRFSSPLLPSYSPPIGLPKPQQRERVGRVASAATKNPRRWAVSPHHIKSSKMPRAGVGLYDIGGAGDAFGGCGHAGGELTGSGRVLRCKDSA